ncbi:MAG: sigma-E factor regulatory protein RseB domain-containing protein [Streptosporangiales bacterium]
MFTRTSSVPDRETPDHDPLPLRIATAAVVLSLIASGVAVVWGDLATRGGVLLPRAAMGMATGQAEARRLPAGPAPARAALTPAQAASAGVRLLSAAAAACRTLSYQGVQISAWHGPQGSVISVMQVWHQRGGQALVQMTTVPAASAAAQARGSHVVADPDADFDNGGQRVADGAMGMTAQMVALLAANYRVSEGGREMVAGRPAEEVVLHRSDGGLAARFWLDSATKLPLRRQVFDTSARLVSQDTFLGLTLGRPAASPAPAVGRMPRGTPLSAGALARLRAAGWPLPGQLPGHLTLVQAQQSGGTPGLVVDLAYSDGLSVVSLFLQRGHLPPQLSGWSRVAVRGQQVFTADPDQRSVAWSARGFVFTVIADAPEATVDQVVTVLPHSARPGFLGRMRRGLSVLASWLNPFR